MCTSSGSTMMGRGDGLGEEGMWFQCKAWCCLRRGKVKGGVHSLPCAKGKVEGGVHSCLARGKVKSGGRGRPPHTAGKNHFHRKMENLFHGHFALSHRQF